MSLIESIITAEDKGRGYARHEMWKVDAQCAGPVAISATLCVSFFRLNTGRVN